jgi:hypothetical protein
MEWNWSGILEFNIGIELDTSITFVQIYSNSEQLLQLIHNICTLQQPGCNATGLQVTSNLENYLK